ncbi:MAG: NAD(P)/FAD-dependent oxidoreductase [Cyanobacteria bacterium P01_F01_bin.86]
MRLNNNTRFDVAIIGSGIAGSTLAAILARQGCQVIVFDAGSHPKFAIGESMILETSEVMRSLAELYEVPELAYFSSENYFDHIGTSHGIKRHFSYLHHTQGASFNRQHTLQAVIPKNPHGHELHLYRQDTDYFLATVAVRYGAKVLQNAAIQSVAIDESGVNLLTKAGETFQANYVVDAGGFRSVLAKQFNLRHHNLQTHSRALFTHMVDVPCFHRVSDAQAVYGLPFKLSEGTLHHVFEGGWLWVIPFDNHPHSTNQHCSVGLMLDPRRYPVPSDLSPEAEFYQFIQQFPDIAAQFQAAKAVRPWVRTARLQYSTKQVVGDRFCLLGQAAGFIDPLFSKGLYTALMCTSVLADRLLAAKAGGDYSAAHFREVEVTTLAFIRANDRLVANAYRSFTYYPLWVSYTVLWLLGAYLELIKLINSRVLSVNAADYYQRLQGMTLVGGAFAQFATLSQDLYLLIENADLGNSQEAHVISQQVKQTLAQVEWMPHAFQQVLKGKNHLPANKLNLRLLRPQQGFMGHGDYRRHFFDERSLSSLARFFLQEQIKYSRPALRLKRAAEVRSRGWQLMPQGRVTAAAFVLVLATGGYASTWLTQSVFSEYGLENIVSFFKEASVGPKEAHLYKQQPYFQHCRHSVNRSLVVRSSRIRSLFHQ